jgi:amidase
MMNPFGIVPPSASYLAQVGTEPGPLRIAMMPHAWRGRRTTPSILKHLAETAQLCASLDHEIEEVEMPLGVSWDAYGCEA